MAREQKPSMALDALQISKCTQTNGPGSNPELEQVQWRSVSPKRSYWAWPRSLLEASQVATARRVIQKPSEEPWALKGLTAKQLRHGPIRSMQGLLFRQYKVITQDIIALKVREKEKS